LRAYFIGIVKLAFVTPAMMRVAIPHDMLLTIGFPPLSFSCYRCDSRVVDHAQSTTGILKVRRQRYIKKHRKRDNPSGILSFNISA
jgi:hypothetical protein